MNMYEFKVLLSKTFIDVYKVNEDEIHFVVSETEKYRLFHWQDCCENVKIESIDGDLKDLIGNEILQAEEVTNANNDSFTEYLDSSSTWTFYKLATIKGYVTIRWLGESNGYYSESVDFERYI